MRRGLPRDTAAPHPLAALHFPTADLNVLVAYDGFRYRKAKFDKFRAAVRLKDGKLSCDRLELRRPGDTLTLSLEVQTGVWNRYHVRLRAASLDVDRLTDELELARKDENAPPPKGKMSLAGNVVFSGRVESRAPQERSKKAVRPFDFPRPPPEVLPPLQARFRLQLSNFQIFRQNTKV
ncbi:MAG: hypothetical protein NZ534_13400, partial [Bacteroidia bacterium]|nr:hypothetical protein [Bacteroidia bacterium]